MAFGVASDGYERFGGELPLGCDPLLPVPRPEPPDVLLFSHGRAALGWLIDWRGPFTAAITCAYTCPSLPRFLAGRGLALTAFDVGAEAGDIAALAAGLPGRLLVLVPALLGFDPWLDAAALALALGERALVVVDAAQTAFGHRRYRPPPGGAVLSCPRKTTAMPDGACLVLDGGSSPEERKAVAALPEATAASEAKRSARALFAAREPAREAEALALAELAEQNWPPAPHRMTKVAQRMLARLDAESHTARRLGNRARLRRQLDDRLPPAFDGAGVPFCHAVLVEDRATFLEALRRQRVFATPLWPDIGADPGRHPRAADLTRRLLALPVDQRYDGADIERLATLVMPSVP